MENVDDRCEVINTNPLRTALTFYMHGSSSGLVPERPGHIVRYGSDLGKGIAFANNEVVGRSIIHVSQVKLYEVFTFKILDAFNDKVVQFFRSVRTLLLNIDLLIQTQIL